MAVSSVEMFFGTAFLVFTVLGCWWMMTRQ